MHMMTWPILVTITPRVLHGLLWISRVSLQRSKTVSAVSQPLTGRDPQNDQTHIHPASDQIQRGSRATKTWPDAPGRTRPDAGPRPVNTGFLSTRATSAYVSGTALPLRIWSLLSFSVWSRHGMAFLLCAKTTWHAGHAGTQRPVMPSRQTET
jgi:hypothetical protein